MASRNDTMKPLYNTVLTKDIPQLAHKGQIQSTPVISRQLGTKIRNQSPTLWRLHKQYVEP